MILVMERWRIKPGMEREATQIMQKMDDLLGPGAHEHPGWCGHARFFQSTARPDEILVLYPWRSAEAHADIMRREEPVLEAFYERYCAAPRETSYHVELPVDVEPQKEAAPGLPQARSPELAGRVALVTGSSRGIGKAIALRLAEQGADVAVNYHSNRGAAEQTAAEIRALGRRTMVVQADVTRPDAAAELFSGVEAQLGPVDILVNNVGDFFFKPLAAMTDDEWRNVMDSNLSSVHYLCRAAVARMRQRKSGRIINIGLSPTYAIRGAPNVAAYSIAKTGVLILTRSLATEEAPHGILVNCVSPGLIDNGYLPPAQKEWMERRVPMGRLGRASEVADAVAFLASDRASYVSGANIAVAGGWDWTDRGTEHDRRVEDLFIGHEEP
ncbi:SDR family oxidoreductase [Sorangium cellulosum]|nr:SDR family NAD(P)-dependent oxidoreductase [Sorangium cellulosum]